MKINNNVLFILFLPISILFYIFKALFVEMSNNYPSKIYYNSIDFSNYVKLQFPYHLIMNVAFIIDAFYLFDGWTLTQKSLLAYFIGVYSVHLFSYFYSKKA